MGMTPRSKSEKRAERMGHRAGCDLVDLGLPTRCPFTRDELRRAWARGYATGEAQSLRGRKIFGGSRSSSTPRQEDLQP